MTQASPQCLAVQAWHFFLHVLYSLKLLLGGRWRDTMKHWSTPHGALIPVQAAMDVVGNLFNVQEPQARREGRAGRKRGKGIGVVPHRYTSCDEVAHPLQDGGVRSCLLPAATVL